MKRAYDEAYRAEIAETQGALFERWQDDAPQTDGCDAVRRYMKSATRAYLDAGDAYLATLGPALLNAWYEKKEGGGGKAGRPLAGFAPNWMGRFYACFQWRTGMPSRTLVDAVSPEWLLAAYPGLHDLDIDLAVEKVARQMDLRQKENEE